MILVIDNYDSFTYNLVQYLGELGADVRVFRNDEISLKEIARLKPERLLISPGPGEPRNAGISEAVILEFAGKMPILGVCLGHQAIGEVFGGKIVRAARIMHGKTSEIYHDGKGVFRGMPKPFTATRYHSLVVERKSLPSVLTVSAWTKEGEIMGLRHQKLKVEGVQFHPESILTSSGKRLLQNFLSL
ncbi:MAG: aminodeoxychorismate/anthranilate synthase component II [Candidatus Margulisiibacteriota bacterium]